MIYEESEFTKASDICPKPQYWHATDGQSTELEVSQLVAAFVRALQPEFVVETGSGSGQTAELIGLALRENKHGRLLTLEIDKDLVEFTRNRCAGLPVDVLHMDSMHWNPNQHIDFAWFDSIEQRRYQEFIQYSPFFSERTIVGFHDTAPHHITRSLIDENLVDTGKIKPIYLPTPRGVCFAQILPSLPFGM